MLLETIFGENWKIIAPLAGAGVALFFPQFKPIIDKFITPAPSPPGPTPPGPTPPTPFFPITPQPQPQPQPKPTPEDFASVVAALQLLVGWFKHTNNEAGEKAIRTAGRALFNEAKNEG